MTQDVAFVSNNMNLPIYDLTFIQIAWRLELFQDTSCPHVQEKSPPVGSSLGQASLRMPCQTRNLIGAHQTLLQSGPQVCIGMMHADFIQGAPPTWDDTDALGILTSRTFLLVG